jgi:hypothetical protein
MKQLAISFTILLALVVAGCQATNDSSSVEAPAVEMPNGIAFGEWIVLLEGTSLEGWNTLGDANWNTGEGYVEASSGNGFLITPDSYRDFHLKLEFWTDTEANSGIFIRCADPNEVGAANAYEVNIYDQRPDPAYRTGGIVNVAEPMEQIDAAGRWNIYEIEAVGPHLVVRLNGTLTVDTEDAQFSAGPIALQYGAGIVRFRNVQIMSM